ncbi:MAG TPA: flagellar basal body rod protein FlgC [Gemmatimonadales bacterium]|nr:flagellar basal body rod protein FlgC [Gemmatimonadales bacterium]
MTSIPPTGATPPGPVRRLFRSLAISASGLIAQRVRMDTIAENIANAETTRTVAGGPYQRLVAEVAPVPHGGGARVAGIVQDTRPGPTVYDPGHPDADANGFVRYPNVDVTAETVDLMVARRAFEANATVFQVGREMLRRALDL